MEEAKTTHEEVKKEEPPKPERSQIKTGEEGYLVAQNSEEAMRLATVFKKSGMLPTRFTSVEMVVTAMEYARQLGLKPLVGIRQIAVIQGTPCAYGDLPLSMAYASGKIEWLKEFLIDQNGKEICLKNANLDADVWGAVAVAKRKGDAEIIERFFTMKDAEQANLLKGPTWKQYPKRMLMYRARSQLLKDKFADAINHVAIAEYDFHRLPETETEDQRFEKAKDIENNEVAEFLKNRGKEAADVV